MNEEELKYYKALQPVFRKKIRSRKLGDYVYSEPISPYDFGFGYITSYSNEQSFGVTFENGFQCGYSASLGEIAGEILLFLPLPIDPTKFERGLWGMIDWRRWRAVQDLSDKTGLTWLFWMPFEHSEVRIKNMIALALLKSLAHQERVKIDE